MSIIVESSRNILASAIKDLEKEIAKSPVQIDDLQFAWKFYRLQYKQYKDAAAKLLEQYVKDSKDSDYQTLHEEGSDYLKKDLKLEEEVKPWAFPTAGKGPSPAPATTTVDIGMKMMLPKRELPQFSGDVREWLAFSASFAEIDGDKGLSDIDKFHFLMQSTKEGSPARKLVQSYPFAAANYQAALRSLGERYGRNSVLVKVYVRDLLQLVIEASSGKSMDFGDLVTTITSQIRNLETLGVTQDKCAQVLYPVVECCLPQDVLQAWQRHSSYKEELKELMVFLQSEVNNYTERALAHFNIAGRGNTNNSSGGKSSKKNKDDVPTTSSFVNGSDGGSSKNNDPSCDFCGKAHLSSDCKKALGMSIEAKRDILKTKRRCFRCLRFANHLAKTCRMRHSCNICTRNHFAVMCPNLGSPAEKNADSSPMKSDADSPKKDGAPTPPPSVPDGKTSTMMSSLMNDPEVPLQTLNVIVHGSNGKRKYVRAVLDPGSQKSYVMSSLVSELELKMVGEETVVHQLFGGGTTEPQRHNKVSVFVTDINGKDNCNFVCSAVPKIAYDILSPPSGPYLEEFRQEGITFTDSVNTSATPIEIMMGNDVVANLYTGRIHRLGYGPAAIETRWGWVLCGKLPVPNRSSSRNSMMVSNLLNIEGHPLSALWELESIGIHDPVEKQEKEDLAKQTQQHFDRTVKQKSDGRYEISLPWITGAKEKLPSNYYVASRRLHATVKDLQVKGHLEKYDELFRKWEDVGMIEEVPTPQLNNKGHYLPHRAVIKLSSSTTPIRPVFDGSSKSKGNLSLNECLDKGPNTLELIPPILTRVRLRQVVATADVEKAFQQISVAPDDRDYLRFLWLHNLEAKEMKVYRHCRVVFGVTSSPYLLGATLRHHLQKASGKEAEVAKKLITSTYVDNAILSFNTFEEAVMFQKTATSLLQPAKFNLRDWEFGPSDNEKTLPILGLLWNTKQDYLALDVSKATERVNEEPSLRRVLSLVHSIFDPLGFVCPFTIVGKLLLRRCHDLKLGLDTPLPGELRSDVLKWASQIPELAEMRVPRHVHFGDLDASYTLHVLCDSSSLATAAAVFLRKELNEKVDVFLLSAKSRVAPKKKATIPRLELVACVIGARLLYSTIEDLDNPAIPVCFWSDSSTALAWIRGNGPWGVFVTNCVDKIKKVTNAENWRHVPGKYNLADLPSRGCSARKLLESQWWKGPEWLRRPPTEWPTNEHFPDTDLVDKERRKTVTVTMVTTARDHPMLSFLRISSYPRILKSMSCWLRLKEKLKGLCANLTDEIVPETPSAADEFEKAEYYLLLFVQEDIRQQPDRLKKLNPFLDERGLMRTRTRLSLDDDKDFQYPIILPDKNEFVARMIRWEHEKHCHVGVSTLLGILREKFWLVNGRRTVRSVLTKCWICRRFTSQRTTAPEALLPKSRSNLGAPFAVTGLDAAGPLILKGGEKVWILLFTCATFRAVHLELINTLSSDGFIRALRRFVSRRGRPNIIYSDNACGFVATQKSFSRINWKKVEEYAAVSRIVWRFNPPSAPWWGGWWERLIGLTKQLLRRILGKRVVHMGELETLLCEVEDCLNNRPLTHISENPDDPLPLTPNHFVRHCGNVFLPEADLHDAMATRSTYKKLQHLREALRSRFRLEYLGLLRGHSSPKRSPELKPGDVVIVERENTKRQDWPLGVIVEAIPGSLGIRRLFRVKTRSGVILRPAQRLFMMEQDEN